MYTLSASEAKTKFGAMLIKAQSEPVKITKNGNPVAVVLSKKYYEKIEQLKRELDRSRNFLLSSKL